MASNKPRILVLGGLGFIGRHLVKLLVDQNVASKIRVVDKIMVQMARLGSQFQPAFDKVETIQANLSNPDAVAKAFTDPEGDYNIVINLAGETKLSQSDGVYEEGITKLSTLVGQEALKHKTERFIEVSTGEVYESHHKQSNESAKLHPWTGIGKAKLKAEEALKGLKGLPLIIVRPAYVYGPSDIRGLAPRLCIAAVYKKTGEKLEFPKWFEEQKINTVHVRDVAKALVHLVSNGAVGEVYNLADKFDTDQTKLNAILQTVFGIHIGHLGTIESQASKLLSAESILEEVNAEHAPTWSKMVSEAKLEYSPLTPWLDLEAVSNKSLALDGSHIESTGFKYDHPEVTETLLREEVQYAVSEGWFPPSLI